MCSGESSRTQAGAFRCLLWDLNSLGHSTQSPGSAGGLVCTQRQIGSTQLAPAALSLGSNPEASGGSLQISASGSRTAWATTPHPQVLEEARGAPGRPSGRSQCALVSPAGPSGSLQVSASGSENPGPQHPVSRQCRRSAVHQRPPGKRQLALVSPALT